MKSSRSATKPEQRLVVHVPQLESLLREAERLPRLISAMLRRCEPAPLDVQCPQAELATGRALPAAPLTRLHDRPGDSAGVWMRADPIGLVPDLAAVWLQADQPFRRGRWQTALSELLDEEGLVLELTESGRGYLRLDTVPRSRFSPPWVLAGASLDHCLPEGPDARDWRRLLNETQVMLQQVRQSEQAPDPVPGSLWFWGAGALPDAAAIDARVCRIVAADPVLLGLAEWLDLPWQNPDGDLDPGGGTLLEWPSRFEESAEANLERLQDFLRRAWRRLRAGRILEIELAGTETVRRFSVGDAWRVWR